MLAGVAVAVGGGRRGDAAGPCARIGAGLRTDADNEVRRTRTERGRAADTGHRTALGRVCVEALSCGRRARGCSLASRHVGTGRWPGSCCADLQKEYSALGRRCSRSLDWGTLLNLPLEGAVLSRPLRKHRAIARCGRRWQASVRARPAAQLGRLCAHPHTQGHIVVCQRARRGHHRRARE